MITVIGMGNRAGDMSVRGLQKLKECGACVIKTEQSPSYGFVAQTGVRLIALDDVYRSSRSFDTLNKNLAARVAEIHRQTGDVCYLVDGSGYDDLSVRQLSGRRTALEIIPAAAKELASAAPGCCRLVLSAADALTGGLLHYSRGIDLYVTEIDSQETAGELKLELLKRADAEQSVHMTADGREITAPLYELDRQEGYGQGFSLRIDAAPLSDRQRYGFADLLEIMHTLCAPGGCPWDREQTHRSIRTNAIEEAYELVEAIDLNDSDKLLEESGDVLLQAVFHAQIASANGDFDVNDMLTALCQKLISRHTHIFGGKSAADAGEALAEWERNKAAEKRQLTHAQSLAALPLQFPALLRAQKAQKKAAKAGYDFESAGHAKQRLLDEIAELERAEGEKPREHEGGDVLFAAVNVLRHLGIDAEVALTAANNRFIGRISAAESLAEKRGKKLEQLSADELEELWQLAKKQESTD